MANPTTINSKMKSPEIKLVVCGTDTDIGKTIISALLVQGLEALYWKPIQSGLSEGSDRERICTLLNLSKDKCIPEVYNFKAPVSPHWAAEKEGKNIDPEKLKLPKSTQSIVIETAGGLMVPITRNCLQIEILEEWKLPVILVARSGLGTINHTLLSLEALRMRRINILGVIFNGPIHSDNPKTIERFGNIPIIAQIPYLEDLNADSLAKEWERQNLNLFFNNFVKCSS